MSPLDVVEVVDVVADGQLGFVASGVVLVVDELSTQGGEEALGDSVVPAVTFAAHAWSHAVGAELGAVVGARVRAAAVRVVKKPRRRLPCLQGRLQRFQRQDGVAQPTTRRENKSSMTAR